MEIRITNLYEIRKNLNQIKEPERPTMVTKVIYQFIAPLHDMVNDKDFERILANLELAAIIKNEYRGLVDSDIISRLRQFWGVKAYNLPPKGLAWIKFILAPPEEKLSDFFKSETAKARLDKTEYIVALEKAMDEWKPQVLQSGFDPFNPKTWDNKNKK